MPVRGGEQPKKSLGPAKNKRLILEAPEQHKTKEFEIQDRRATGETFVDWRSNNNEEHQLYPMRTSA